MEQNIATRIRKLREKLKLSQFQAAELWDLPCATLKAWEAGTVVPNEFSALFINKLLEDEAGPDARSENK